MGKSNYNIRFNELYEKLSLGEIINEPVQVSGVSCILCIRLKLMMDYMQ